MIALTLWHSDGLRRALAGAHDVLLRVRPDVVQLHDSPDGLRRDAPGIAAEVRRMLPSARVWLGVACDSPARRYAEGAWLLERAADALLVAADTATAVHADTIVWNAEAGWKRLDPTRPDCGPLARMVVTRCHAANPELVQGHTAYDQPGLHGVYPWAGWLGDGTVKLALPQVYCAPDDGLASKGAQERRYAAHSASWATARRKGWIATETVVPYLQAHGIPAGQLVTLAGRLGAACFWAAPSRMDAEGERALRALATLRDAGFTGPGAVRAYQAAKGLVADGIAGPLTMAALLGEQRKGLAP
ncbi:MAG: peptidoglycan-binding protein [Rhodocyclaceae bacterium]|nr:MAG: peptidoglycan-binding protein [Rhodocyclaceae bacterium]